MTTRVAAILEPETRRLEANLARLARRACPEASRAMTTDGFLREPVPTPDYRLVPSPEAYAAAHEDVTRAE